MMQKYKKLQWNFGKTDLKLQTHYEYSVRIITFSFSMVFFLVKQSFNLTRF
jgi:hypothetical protein